MTITECLNMANTFISINQVNSSRYETLSDFVQKNRDNNRDEEIDERSYK